MVRVGFKGLGMRRKVRSCLGAASPNFPEAANSSKTTECGIEESLEPITVGMSLQGHISAASNPCG
jgi:hypothetical protein